MQLNIRKVFLKFGNLSACHNAAGNFERQLIALHLSCTSVSTHKIHSYRRHLICGSSDLVYQVNNTTGMVTSCSRSRGSSDPFDGASCTFVAVLVFSVVFNAYNASFKTNNTVVNLRFPLSAW